MKKITYIREVTQVYKESDLEAPTVRITAAEDAIHYACDKFTKVLAAQPKEKFVVLYLDIRNKIVAFEIISSGNISASVVDPADILRGAVLSSASRIVLIHNHPSGECDPSKEDIDTTNKIIQALKYVGIKVLDHVIVGIRKDQYFSFARAGMV